MGIILSAMAAAGDAGVQSENQNIAQLHLLEAEKQKSILDVQKAQAISDIQAATANAPASRAGDLIRASTAEQIPVQALPITRLSGNDPDSQYQGSDGAATTGLSGDYQTLKNQISKIQDVNMQSAAMEQLERQRASDQAAAQSALKDQTRPRNQSEIFADAMSKASASGDMQAYTAIKAAAGDKFTIVPDGASYINNQTGQLTSTNSAKDDRQEEKDNRADQRQQKILDARFEVEAMKESAKAKAIKDAADPYGVFSGSGPGADGSPAAALSHGDEFLKTLPIQAQEQVKALSEGRLSFPTGAAMRSPYAQNLVAMVSQYDPQFDAINYGARAATRKDFTSGKASDSINAVNTVMQHLSEYLDAGNDLNNSSLRPLNYVMNGIQDATGDPRLTKFNTTRNAVIDEVEKAYRGSGGSQAGIEAWKENMTSSQSPAQIAASGTQLVKLLEGKMEALGDQYTKGMGVARTGLELLSPKAQAVYNRVIPNGMRTPIASPVPGAALNYDPKTGTFH